MSKSTSPKHLQQKQTQHSTSPHISTTSKKHSVFTADNLKSTHFALSKIIHHGFSYRPTCMCYDSKSSLIAIGTEFGYIRIFGREYIDKCFRDDISSAVLFVSLKTIVEGEKETLRLITISYPSQISLWVIDDFKLQRICCRTFAKEKYSCGHFSQSGKLLFFGCETGNVYILDSSTLALSKQIIHWNRAVGPSVHIHPGPVVVLSSCLNDKQKLFIGYSPCGSSDAKSQDNKSKAGILVKWNLKHLKFEEIAIMHSGLTCISWHPEGKYMLCGHADGSYSAWNLKSLDKPIKIERPHCLISSSTDAEYHPLSHILQISSKIGDVSTCFSGGIHLDSCLRSKYVTIVRKRSTNVLQMDSAIVDMQLIHDSNVEPVAIAILLEEDLMFVDLKSEELLFHKSPHSTIFGKNSPITFIDYIASPPNKFYYNLLKLHNCFNEKITRDVDRRQSITYTNVPFPLTGGVPGETIFSYNEIIITGHMDGKVCFWDSSAMNLSPIYTISTERFIYSKTEGSPTDTTLCNSSNINTDDTFSSVGNDSTASPMLSVKSATLSSYNDNDCLIVVGNFGHVTLMKFNMDHTDSTDELTDISVLDIPALVSPTPEQSPDKSKSVSKQLFRSFLNVRVACRRLLGFHPDIVCLIPSNCTDESENIRVNADLSNDHEWLVLLLNRRIIFVDTIVKSICAVIDVDELRVSVDPIVFASQQISPTRDKYYSSFSPDYSNDQIGSISTSTFNTADDHQPTITAEEFSDAVTDNTDASRSSIIDNEDDTDDGDNGLHNEEERPTKKSLTARTEKHRKSIPFSTVPASNDTPLCNDNTGRNRTSSSIPYQYRRTMAGSLRHGLSRLSMHTLKIRQKEKSSNLNSIPVIENSDIQPEEGVLVAFCTRMIPESEGNSSTQQLMWIATSAGRTFAVHLSVDDPEHKSLRLIRYWDPIKIPGDVLLVKFIIVTNTGESYLAPCPKRLSTLHNFYIVLASSTTLRVCCIPDACCIYERTVSSEIQAAWISNFNDAVYLCVMEIDTPVLQVFSIPKLDSLFEYCLQLNKDEFSGLISQRLICSNFGMVCCLLNPFEICKWSLSVDISTKVHTMYGHLLQTDNNRKQIKSAIGSTSGRQRLGTPNSDSTGYFFFKIFSSNESFDEQSLFEKSGRSDEPHGVFVKSDSNLFDTSSPINRTTSAINSANSEVSQMLRAGEERGMRLNQLDQATARMAEGAREFQHRAKQLSQMHKHRSEKWWQLWK